MKKLISLVLIEHKSGLWLCHFMFYWSFQDIEARHIINQDICIDAVDSTIHECVMFEDSYNENVPQNTFENLLILDGLEHELRLISGITEINII